MVTDHSYSWPNIPSRKLWIGFSLAALIILTYWPAIDGDFVWDDVFLIRDNPDLTSLGRAWSVAWGDYYQQGSESRTQGGYFRPLPILLNGLTIHFFGLNPTAFHLTNLILHILAVWLASLFLLKRGFSVGLTIWVTACFATHPLQTESVNFISCRSDLLATVGVVGALLAYEKSRSEGKWWMWVSAMSYAVALLSKEIGLVLPAVLVWLEQTTKGGRMSRIWMLTCVSVLYLMFRLSSVTEQPSLYFSPNALPIAVLNLLGLYTSRAVWPLDPHLLYDSAQLSTMGVHGVIGLIVLTLFIAIIWTQRHSDAGVGLGMVIFVVFLVPVLHLVPLKTVAAERYLYLPILGISIALATVTHRCLETFRTSRGLVLVLWFTSLFLMSVLGHLRSQDWQTEVKLWSAEIALNPSEYKGYANLGTALAEKGLFVEARKAFGAAWRLRPNNPVVWRNLVRLEALRLPSDVRTQFIKLALSRSASRASWLGLIERLKAKGLNTAAELLNTRLYTRPQ